MCVSAHVQWLKSLCRVGKVARGAPVRVDQNVMITEDRLIISNSSYHMNKDHLIRSSTPPRAWSCSTVETIFNRERAWNHQPDDDHGRQGGELLTEKVKLLIHRVFSFMALPCFWTCTISNTLFKYCQLCLGLLFEMYAI